MAMEISYSHWAQKPNTSRYAITDAIENALDYIETLNGHRDGDIYEALAVAKEAVQYYEEKLKREHRSIAFAELELD